MKFAIALLVLTNLVFCVRARCVMRGECAVVGGHAKPCAVDHEATPFTDAEGVSSEHMEDIANQFARICPDLALNDEGNLKPNEELLTCCNHIQIAKMADSLLMAQGVLGRCPACFRNFVRQICEMNCSPDQSRFVDVIVANTTDGINQEYVDVINYMIHNEFMDGAFASCSSVLVPQTGLPAVTMMCGAAPICDADAFFGFTGDMTQNPLAPVQVNFLRTADPEQSMSVRALPCNETFADDLPCSCMDCFVACPEGTEPFVPAMCTVLGLNCIAFSTAIVFFVITVTVFSLLTIYDYKKTRNDNFKPKLQPQNVNKMIKMLQFFFVKVGLFSASNPTLILMLTSWLSLSMLFGIFRVNLIANPTELWSSSDSQGRIELNYFNTRFGPFYRAAQVFLTFDLEPFEVNDQTYGPAFRIEAIQELIQLEQKIINIGRDEGSVVLEDVCYAPNRLPGTPPDLDICVSMSVSVYLAGETDPINNNTYLTKILSCLNNPYALDCLASWGGGSETGITFGGYDGDDILSAHTLVITYPIANHMLSEDLEPALQWEAKFIELLFDYEKYNKSDFVTVAFGAERSIEDEIERISVAEAVPIVISYIIMFIYVIIALGNVRSWKTYFIDSKIMVAIGSIIIVIDSIFCGMGVVGYINVTITLFSLNLIPFFLLSVGIDNVFLMVNTLQDIQGNLGQYSDYKENLSYEKKRNFIFEKMLEKIGPSIFVSSVTQITCFSLGALSSFPAIETFAIFASISLGFLFLFQITTVVALLSIDYKRSTQNRFDVFFCIQKKILVDEDPLNSETPYKSITQRLMEPYSKFIVDWRVKIVVAVLFMTMASVSVVMIPNLEIGLDEELALPHDSYVYKYLLAVTNYLMIGPPVYFVLKEGLNFTDINHQNTICGGQLCYEDSLATQIFLASLNSNVTYIARSSNSWLDDFSDWSNLYGACCKYNSTDDSFCQSLDNSPECNYCTIERYNWANGLRPHPEAFERYIPFFLVDQPSEICNKGGLASYSSAVNYILDSEGRATVHDSNFMSYHTPLSTSYDYISAVYYGREISKNITRAIQEHTGLEVEVFAYSVFYIYYEQYLSMWKDTFLTILFCLGGATFFNIIASGFSITTTLSVIFTSALVVVNMMGVMYLWDIPLNPLSGLNLIVTIGIAVEFCSHIGYALMTSQHPPRERVSDAVRSVGATVITGITFTNIPVVVLAFSYTEMIEIFFFRMFLSIVGLSFLHGMIFYPVLLSFISNVNS